MLRIILGGGVKVYKVLLTQSGTNAPTVTTVFENTVGDVVWTRGDAGLYTGTLSGAFPSNKVLIETPYQKDFFTETEITLRRNNSNSIQLANQLTQDYGGLIHVSVYVYP